MQTKPVVRTKKTTQRDRIIRRHEQRISRLEDELDKQRRQREVKQQMNWIDWATAFNVVASLFIQIPAIIAIIYEIMKLIFH